MNLGLQGKTALVSASSKGIGKAIALSLAKEGVNLLLCSRHKNILKKTAEEIQEKTGQRVSFLPTDLGQHSDIKNLVQFAQKRLGTIDILVTNIGGPPPGSALAIREPAFKKAHEDIFLSVVRLCRLVAPGMKKRKWGRIICMTSVSVKQPIPDLTLSNAYRAAVVGFAQTLKEEVAPYGITVNVICPGYTKTDRMKELLRRQATTQKVPTGTILKKLSRSIPMKRMAKPEEISCLVAFLASKQAGYLTGNVITVDGGVTRGLI